ncbi:MULTISPECIES: response regulator [Methylococcus]|jgi:DNA-binding NarL/FixJ family response regulator|uniref:DNA binding response regulator, LuxR family n=2 Tax=Methylococcus capsulatus TaxID=414 RepID=Q60AR8_METCA|nr:response regulator transcription factor [Methylococcus capsulatus]AAU92937.1 DNA binding response regulator, LuxR family [Methylococcus capsulatus str. Bath]QXP88445.1 response regulator transcription factor [Methylococcus capsulatus]QXP90203.1 response regulator transcription factor [Methylococcus capsulatus]QXP94538.1 response regulator transcription factor [Methylococcus capsulatus]UQN13491.1 response regulator transcription factor [Methylococcus capsulatus]
MKSKITVMLVDDHAVVRAGYRLLLSGTPNIEVVGEAERGEEACQLYADTRPDVIVMDLSLPGIGGLASIRRIRSRDTSARILVFSIHDELIYVVRALEAGARGYITKSCAPEILVEAVARIASGESFLEPEIAQRLAMQTLGGAEATTALNTLSAREFDVFLLLAKGYTTREVAEELRLGYKTVANYSTLIKSKLGVNTTAEMARLAYQNGIFKT